MGDTEESERIVIVNETWAKAYSPDRDPVGRRVRVFDVQNLRRIAGVVGDVRHTNIKSDPTPIMYGPYNQLGFSREMSLVILSEGSMEEVVQSTRNVVRSVDPDIPIYDVRPLADVVSNTIANPRFTAALVGLFSIIALALASIGLYGVIRYAVNQRVPEIGIRVACGAQKTDILKLIVGNGLALTFLGVVSGLILSLALMRLLESQLFSVSPTDPVILLVVAATCIAVALIASLIPAFQATRLDPVKSLRQD
jgi:ABC-type antimicrobial peptide transport system permease subunit